MQKTILDPHRLVKVYRCGEHVEVIQTAVDPKPPNVRRFDATHFINCDTGELFVARRSDSRCESPENVMKTVVRLRRIINANVCPKRGDMMITLTYDPKLCGGPMRDAERVMDDFERFRARLVALYGRFEYVAVIEPQQSGSWHLHVLVLSGLFPVPDLRRDRKAWYRLNHSIGLLWAQGFAHVRSLRDCSNVGLYLSSYLINDGTKKRARLHYYPRGIRIYRCSRGIIRPEPQTMTAADALAQLAAAESALLHQQQTIIERDDGKQLQTVRYCYFQLAAAGRVTVVNRDAVSRTIIIPSAVNAYVSNALAADDAIT